jgi:hypothetical protein
VDIHDDDIRLKEANRGNGLFGVFESANNFELRMKPDHVAETFAHLIEVFHYGNADTHDRLQSNVIRRLEQ